MRRHLLLLRLLQRHSDLPMQSRFGLLPLRKHQRRRLHHLHQRRQEVLRDDPGLLRLHRRLLLPAGLLLLHLVQGHPGVLRNLLIESSKFRQFDPRQPWSNPLGAVFFCIGNRATPARSASKGIGPPVIPATSRISRLRDRQLALCRSHFRPVSGKALAAGAVRPTLIPACRSSLFVSLERLTYGENLTLPSKRTYTETCSGLSFCAVLAWERLRWRIVLDCGQVVWRWDSSAQLRFCWRRPSLSSPRLRACFAAGRVSQIGAGRGNDGSAAVGSARHGDVSRHRRTAGPRRRARFGLDADVQRADENAASRWRKTVRSIARPGICNSRSSRCG